MEHEKDIVDLNYKYRNVDLFPLLNFDSIKNQGSHLFKVLDAWLLMCYNIIIGNSHNKSPSDMAHASDLRFRSTPV